MKAYPSNKTLATPKAIVNGVIVKKQVSEIVKYIAITIIIGMRDRELRWNHKESFYAKQTCCQVQRTKKLTAFVPLMQYHASTIPMECATMYATSRMMMTKNRLFSLFKATSCISFF